MARLSQVNVLTARRGKAGIRTEDEWLATDIDLSLDEQLADPVAILGSHGSDGTAVAAAIGVAAAKPMPPIQLNDLVDGLQAANNYMSAIRQLRKLSRDGGTADVDDGPLIDKALEQLARAVAAYHHIQRRSPR